MTLRPSVAQALTEAGIEPADTERAVRAALDEDLHYGEKDLMLSQKKLENYLVNLMNP